MTSRKEKLDELTVHAKTLLEKEPKMSIQEFEDECEKYMMTSWYSSSSTRSDYLRHVKYVLEKEMAGRKAYPEIPIDEDVNLPDMRTLYGKPQTMITKIKLFNEIFKTLEDKKGDVEEKTLIRELLKTGRYNEEEANNQIRKSLREGIIFEVRQGILRRA